MSILPLRKLYTLLLYLLAPLVLARLAWRGIASPEYLRRWPERFGSIRPALGKHVIWVHAVSVGEVQAAEPLVRALTENYKEFSVLVTTVTPTGSARVLALFGDKVAHVYAPYDLPGAVRRFLGRVRPQLVLIMETELWPNLYHACHKEHIPLLLVNGRLSEKSLSGYRKVYGLVSRTLSAVTEIAAQSEQDAIRFKELGADPGCVSVTGNIKFDQKNAPDLLESAAQLRHSWGSSRPVWIAASTHEGEDELLLDVFRQVRKQHKDCLLVLVPRHPERFSPVAALCRNRGYNVVLRSERQPCTAETGVFIGDSMGELPLFYAASDIAFVGGSLVRSGGHNLLEPASLGIPVVTGPHLFNFAEIARLMLDAGACVQAENTAEIVKILLHWIGDADERRRVGEQGRAVVEKNRGALKSVLAMVERYLAII